MELATSNQKLTRALILKGIVPLLLIAMATGAVMGQATPRGKQVAATSDAEVGRFQVITSPAAMRHVFLLDTATGTTWVFCEGDDGDAWCIMPRTTGRSVRPAKPSGPRQN